MLKQIYADLVHKVVQECRLFYGEHLISICVYGSVGRDTMNYCSDIDILLVVNSLPQGRIQRNAEFSRVEDKLKSDLTQLRKNDIHPELSPILKTPEEVQQGSLLFLDMLEDGKILVDEGNFLKDYFSHLAKQLKDMGARRIRKGETWYWDLKPDYKPGDIFII